MATHRKSFEALTPDRLRAALDSEVDLEFSDGQRDRLPLRDVVRILRTAGLTVPALPGEPSAPAPPPTAKGSGQKRGRGRTLVMRYDSDDDTPPLRQSRADHHLQLLKQYAAAACSDDAHLREWGRNQLRVVAEKLATHDRDRINQHGRREGKPATSDEYDTDRNGRIRRHCARLVEQKHKSPVSQTAAEFGVSRSTVQRINKAPPR